MSRNYSEKCRSFNQNIITINDGFWKEWRDKNNHLLDHQYDQLIESGALENFERVIHDRSGFEGMKFIDSDVYKWLEAASFALESEDDGKLQSRIDDIISLVSDTQAEDGYLNTYIMQKEPEKRWTNLARLHELYCAGHLIEAAVAHYRATGETTLLDVARSFADHIDETFGPDRKDGTPGHEEIELALVKLYRVTEEERYLDLARFFIDKRGRGTLEKEFDNPDGRAGDTELWEHARHLFLDDEGNYDGRYAQDHRPVEDQDAVEGHAVRSMYLLSAVTDVVAETGDEALREAVDRLWENMTTKRMYITGGIGPEPDHEGFTEDYDLRNEAAYAETCAAVGSIFWNHRLFKLTGDSKYTDLIERVLYNGFLAGISLSGTEFFYANPLEIGPDGHPLSDENSERFTNQRQSWFECACCPPNMARLFASLEDYIYARSSSSDIYINQFINSELDTSIKNNNVRLTQESNYPWEGPISVQVSIRDPTKFTLNIRLPEWCTDVTASINGDQELVTVDANYLTVNRQWNDGDEIIINLQQQPKKIATHPNVTSNIGKVALKRGPIVYCLEEVDNDWPLHYYSIPPEGDIDVELDSQILNNVAVLQGEARIPNLDSWDKELYREHDYSTNSVEFEAIPYYAWANRVPGEMRVWLRTT